jgi:hypothetical protein
METVSADDMRAVYEKYMIEKERLKEARCRFVAKHKEKGDYAELKKRYNKIYNERKKAKNAEVQ